MVGAGAAQPGLGAGSVHHVLHGFAASPRDSSLMASPVPRRLTLRTSETPPISSLPLGEVSSVLLHFSVSPPSAPTTLSSPPPADEQVSTVVRSANLRVRSVRV